MREPVYIPTRIGPVYRACEYRDPARDSPHCLLNRLLGKARALKLSIFTGSLLAFIVCYLLVPGIGLTTYAGHWILGLVLALFMAAFDLVMGRLLLRRPWSKAFSDFNPATGNYLIYGLALLMVYPTLVGLCRGTL